MTESVIWPPAGDAWTVLDLEQFPDDGRRYEIIEGSLLVSPTRGNNHIRAADRLAAALVRQVTSDFAISMTGLGLLLGGGKSYLIPDLTVLHADAYATRGGNGFLPEDLALVVEVLSPSNPGNDTVMKRWLYGKAGIPNYWIADPRERWIRLLAHDGDEGYVEQSLVTSELVTDRPFPIRIALDEIFDPVS